MVENKENPPVFCEKLCIVCKGAREGNGICKTIQNIELKIFGKNGCIWGAARTKYYGVTPDKKLPESLQRNKQKQTHKKRT
ncbi:MAG: hypothetical protein NHB15_13280 [Methanosarcina barkeri]|nr:hypothetical protein [Methanosarcina sp. ERenArc_MAG2]